MLAQRRRPLSVRKVNVVLVGLGHDDLVHGHLCTASAHALVHVVVLLIAWHARLTIGEIGEYV